MDSVTRVSATGKINLPARIRREIGLDQGGPVVVRAEGGEIRIRPVQDVLTDLQAEARRVFAGSGETVERFLQERRDAAAREEDAT